MELLLGFPVIKASTHARQIIQSLLPARPKKQKKKQKEREGGSVDKTGQETQLYLRRDHCAPEEVATNKVIIQSTLNSEVTSQQKGQLWQDIARKGSNCGVCVRTPDQVRGKS